MASSSKEKRSMALLRSSPFFLKAPLRGEGRAARCLLAKCLWSSCRQAGRTSWSRTLQAGCGVHPLPGGRQQLAQGARRTGGQLRLTAYQHQQSRRLHITDQREREPGRPPLAVGGGKCESSTAVAPLCEATGKNVAVLGNSPRRLGRAAPSARRPDLRSYE